MDNSPWKDLKFYIKKEENKWALVMEHFKSILFHKYGPANTQHTYQSINQSMIKKFDIKYTWQSTMLTNYPVFLHLLTFVETIY